MTRYTREAKPERKAAHDKYHGHTRLETKYDLLGHDTNALATCDRKKRYKTKQSAKEAVSLAKRNGWKRYAYACSVCRGWHLTKQDPATARRIRRGWTGSRASAPEAAMGQVQESDPAVNFRAEPESDHPSDEVLLLMTNEATNTETSAASIVATKIAAKHTDIARAAGYAPAEDFGEANQTLDALCRECDLTPMVLGTAKFYPVEEAKKELAARAVPDGMVAAIDWAQEHGVNRNKVPNAIRDGKYPGRSHFGKAPGLVGKSRYYVVPEEAAEFCGLNKKPEPAARPTTTWTTLEEAARLTGMSKADIRHLGEKGEVLAKNEMGEYQVLWDDLDAYVRAQQSASYFAMPYVYPVSAPLSPSVAPPPAIVSINEDVMRMMRESNERQRELHAEMRELVEQLKSIESRIDAKLAAGAAVWKKTVADRDAAHAQSIAEAVAQALDEFERGKRRVA